MRRQRVNYHLFTEPESHIDDMVGASLSGVFTGVRRPASDLQTDLPEATDVATQCHGGPLFLYFSAIDTTWVVESDEILRSLVTRRVKGNPESSAFLDDLYFGSNAQPDFLRAKMVVDLSQVWGVNGREPVVAVHVYKLPDNHDHSVSKRIYAPHQCAIEFVFGEAKLLIGYQLDSALQGHRFITWDDVRASFPQDQLSVCREIKREEVKIVLDATLRPFGFKPFMRGSLRVGQIAGPPI